MDRTADKGGLRIGGDRFPKLADDGDAAVWLADLAKAADEAGCERLARLAASDDHDAGRLGAVMALSPFLRGLMLRVPKTLEELFDADAHSLIEARLEALAQFPLADQSESDLMRALRLAKADVALLVALRDLFGAAHPAETTMDLSLLAEASCGAALRLCLREAARAGKVSLKDDECPEAGSGLFVLGMGKLGGYELNYSSDIDLIVFFDPDAGIAADPSEAVATFSKIVRRFVRLISERSKDGYVFRTDLRLRPDPGAMPLAISTDMAMTYYESSGRNWERAAMIKARPICGDAEAGEAFLAELAPFVWRKYLDFAAISDIQEMKGRIDQSRGFGAIAIPGHNVKLGRGGIREIEFFVQTQQLIAGGRNPALRTRRTEEALNILHRSGWIEAEVVEALGGAYWFLRRVEHAVQMIADEQTHELPTDPEGLATVAGLLGFEDRRAFAAVLTRHLTVVDAHFNALFNDGRTRDAKPAANPPALVRILGNEDDPQGLEAIAALGFSRPADVARIVRSWSFGRYRATRTEKARARLAEVLPSLIAALAGASDPDGAVAAFDRFLSGLPSGIQFFPLIAPNPKILDLLALIITAAPALTATLGARPHVFDALLDPEFYEEVPDRSLIATRLAAFLAVSTGYEDTLARLRVFASEQRFLVGARMLSGVVDLDEAGPAFTNIADTVLEAVLAAVVEEFASRHGHVPGTRLALVGMGRLGSRELTASSDVDLILLYDHDEEAEESDGPKPLPVQTYFTRLTQRLIAALTAPMREGTLYEVDFRLRPSGNAGPLATRLPAFRKYQETEAWTWERMALTRARIVVGDPAFVPDVEAAIDAVLSKAHDPDEVSADVAAMRHRIEKDKPGRGPLDLKLRAGGLIDLEFIAQWAQLTGKVTGVQPGTPTADILAAFSDQQSDKGSAGPQGEGDLGTAMRQLSGVMQLCRLGSISAKVMEDLPPALAMRVASSLNAPDAAAAVTVIDSICADMRKRFDALLGSAPA